VTGCAGLPACSFLCPLKAKPYWAGLSQSTLTSSCIQSINSSYRITIDKSKPGLSYLCDLLCSSSLSLSVIPEMVDKETRIMPVRTVKGTHNQTRLQLLTLNQSPEVTLSRHLEDIPDIESINSLSFSGSNYSFPLPSH